MRCSWIDVSARLCFSMELSNSSIECSFASVQALYDVINNSDVVFKNVGDSFRESRSESTLPGGAEEDSSLYRFVACFDLA